MSQVLPQDWVVVPLAKFSHNTCSAGTRNIVWSHVSLRDDLDIVFQNSKFVDGFGNVVNRIIMKITAGSELLETQDLGDLVRICRSMPETTAGADHPVQIVVKSPFLAVRYPQHPNHVRRIQVKLKNDADFMKVKSILEDLGLPIFSSAPTSSTSVPPAQARRPSISPAPSIFSSVSSSTLGHAPSGRPVATALIPTMQSSPTKSPFKVPLLPDNAQRPASNPSYFTNQGPSRTSSAFAMPTLGDPFTEATPGASMNRMPSLYLSQMERQSSSRQQSYPAITPPIDSYASIYLARRSDSQQSQAESQTGIQAWDMPPKRVLPFPVRPNSTSNVPSPLTKSTTTPRAESAATGKKKPILDPKPAKRVAQRKTPAAKASKAQESSKEGQADSTEAAKDTSTSEGTSTKAPKAAKKSLNRKASKAISGGKGVVEVLEAVSLEVDKQDLNVPTTSTTTIPVKPPVKAPSRKRATPISCPAAKRPKMVDASTQTQTLTGQDHTSTPEQSNIAKTPQSCHPVSPPQDFNDTLEGYISKHACPAPRERQMELWETPGYADMDDEERNALFHDFVCENLDNKDFLQLLGDMHVAWQKAGFGM